jgi:hypothetical protein
MQKHLSLQLAPHPLLLLLSLLSFLLHGRVSIFRIFRRRRFVADIFGEGVEEDEGFSEGGFADEDA